MKRQRINFIPTELRPKFKIGHEVFPITLMLAMFIYCGGSSLRYSSTLGIKKQKLSEVASTSSRLATQVRELSERNQLLDKNDKAISAIQKVVNRKNYWSEIFKELSILIPDGIWLTHFTDRKGPLSAGETRLSLSGEADSGEVVARFLTVLEKSHHFAGVQMNSLEKEDNILPIRYKFEFTVPVKILTIGGGT